MPLKSSSKSTYCIKFNKPVIITESYNTDEGNRSQFYNSPICSETDCPCRECMASGWRYQGEKKQYWE
jgi:hypothetical protein